MLDAVAAAGRSAEVALADTPFAAEVDGLTRRLYEPLRVAIAGRVKAGKSTLLNALVGERLAPTDASECTRIVTVYKYALGYEVHAILRDGRREEMPFRRTEGALQVGLGSLNAHDVDRIEVGWPSAALSSVTLIDTPGLASADDENSLRTREFLALDEGRAADVDAVIYLMRHMHRLDAEFLDAFLDRSVGTVSPVNAVVVLSRADEIGACRIDALGSANRIAQRYRADERLRGAAATVIPLAGLIAETGLTLRETEAHALRQLAELETGALRLLLLSADGFAAASIDSPSLELRRELLDRFGVFGLRLALSALKSGKASTAADLSRLLVEQSGVVDLRRQLNGHFFSRTQTLKARTTLAGLRDVARRAAGSRPAAAVDIQAEVERIMAGSHELAELRLAHLAMTGSARLNDAERGEVQRLTAARTPAERAGLTRDANRVEIAAAALGAIERWRARAEDPLVDPVTAEAAAIAVRSYEGVFATAQATSASSS